ncbi:MAG: lipase family protein [Spirochaetaceae bacterium]|nr:MAG: lipase family protein [Spirochaetaceae bacterium]
MNILVPVLVTVVLLLSAAACVTAPLTPLPPGDPADGSLSVDDLQRVFAMTDAAIRRHERFRDFDWDLDYFWDNETYTQGVAILDRGVYHVAIRGTTSSDLIAESRINFSARARRPRYQPLESPFRAHNGFLRRYESVRGEIVRRVFEHREYPIVLAGFSAGGAVATLAYFDLLEMAPDLDLQLVTFASPRVLTPRTLAQLRSELPPERLLTITRVVNSNDPIPTLPPPWLGYRHVGNLVQIGRPRRLLFLGPTDHYPGTRRRMQELSSGEL